MPAFDRDRTVMVLGLVALMLFATQVTGFVKRNVFGSHDHHVVVDRVIEVHPHIAVPVPPVAPMAPIPPNHAFELQRAAEAAAVAEAQAQLAEAQAQLADEAARLADVLAPPAPTIRSETVRVGDREVSVVVKS